MTPTIQVTNRGATDVASDGVIVFQFAKTTKPASPAGRYAAKIQGQVKARGFGGKVGETIHFEVGSGAKSKTIIVTGLGPAGSFDAEALQLAAASAARAARSLSLKVVACGLAESKTIDLETTTRRTILALRLGLYAFTKYKKGSESKSPRRFVVSTAADSAKQILVEAEAMARGIEIARDMVNETPEVMNPQGMVTWARSVAKESGLSIKVLNTRQIKQQNMHALLAVARGSDIEPAVIHFTYKPKTKAKKKIAFIGKGVTFDSGGYNLKLGDNILAMKCDMAGSAAVVGAMSALAALEVPVEVHGVIGMVENLVNGIAYKPGDILNSRLGKTIEIVNTDAEGRLVLADLLDYVRTDINPSSMINLATLTGACVVALGPLATGLMSNDEGLSDQLRDCAKAAGEKVWPLPLYEEYLAQLHSDIADLRNAGKRYGGALTAGLFLREFVPAKTPWAHMDIAGPAYLDAPHAFHGKGGTGAGVGTLLEYALSQ